MSVTAKTRAIVYDRDRDCIVRGVTQDFQPCDGTRTVQHTVARGMGGSKKFDTPDLLVQMCGFHNALLVSDAKFQKFGRERGWVRDRNASHDPRQTPVLYSDGWFRLVGNERVPVPTPEALDRMAAIGIQVF